MFLETFNLAVNLFKNTDEYNFASYNIIFQKLGFHISNYLYLSSQYFYRRKINFKIFLKDCAFHFDFNKIYTPVIPLSVIFVLIVRFIDIHFY